MGGAVSAGDDNEELVDNLVDADYIKTPTIETVMRVVDRGAYYKDDQRETAYKDLAWKYGNLHLSAPCIYCEALESLNLERGNSFLNIGSGTGYLSTLAGLLLGKNGINHGIELYPDVVEFAKERLEDFLETSSALDLMDFASPEFVVGNCHQLDVSNSYDRVYCGAAVPEEHQGFIKSLVNVGGILVMPSGDQLLQITRSSETDFHERSVLPVSFATLVSPTSDQMDKLSLPIREPLELQSLAREAIREILRANVRTEYPETVVNTLVGKKQKESRTSDTEEEVGEEENGNRRQRRTSRPILIPMFESDSEDTDDDGIAIGLNRIRRNIIAIGASRLSRNSQALNSAAVRRNRVFMNNRWNGDESRPSLQEDEEEESAEGPSIEPGSPERSQDERDTQMDISPSSSFSQAPLQNLRNGTNAEASNHESQMEEVNAMGEEACVGRLSSLKGSSDSPDPITRRNRNGLTQYRCSEMVDKPGGADDSMETLDLPTNSLNAGTVASSSSDEEVSVKDENEDDVSDSEGEGNGQSSKRPLSESSESGTGNGRERQGEEEEGEEMRIRPHAKRRSVAFSPAYQMKRDEEMERQRREAEAKEEARLDREEMQKKRREFSRRLHDKIAFLPVPKVLRDFIAYYRKSQ